MCTNEMILTTHRVNLIETSLAHLRLQNPEYRYVVPVAFFRKEVTNLFVSTLPYNTPSYFNIHWVILISIIVVIRSIDTLMKTLAFSVHYNII